MATIAPAAEATQGELATVCTSTTAIRQEVAAMVPTIRAVRAVAPAPAARIEAGHQTIYGAAQAAEAAAGQAKAQVETITASASQAEKELAKLRGEQEAERAAWAKERAEHEAYKGSLRRWLAWGLTALGGLGIVAAIAWLFVFRGDLGAAAGIGAAGAACIGAGELLARYGQWLMLAVVVVAGAGAFLAILLSVRNQRAESAAKAKAADEKAATMEKVAVATVGFGEVLKARAPESAVDAAKQWAKDNVDKPVRDLIWNYLPHEPRK